MNVMKKLLCIFSLALIAGVGITLLSSHKTPTLDLVKSNIEANSVSARHTDCEGDWPPTCEVYPYTQGVGYIWD